MTKSMLVVDESDGEELCFAMLEPLREYARQKISELGVEPTWRRRHAQHYARDMGHVATEQASGFPSALRQVVIWPIFAPPRTGRFVRSTQGTPSSVERCCRRRPGTSTQV